MKGVGVLQWSQEFSAYRHKTRLVQELMSIIEGERRFTWNEKDSKGSFCIPNLSGSPGI